MRAYSVGLVAVSFVASRGGVDIRLQELAGSRAWHLISSWDDVAWPIPSRTRSEVDVLARLALDQKLDAAGSALDLPTF